MNLGSPEAACKAILYVGLKNLESDALINPRGWSCWFASHCKWAVYQRVSVPV